MSIYTIEKNTIRVLFRQNKLDIPPIQRSYSWTKDRAEMLWDDLFAYMEDSEREDFWDTMIFRISPWALRHRSIDVATRNQRALCLDEYIIIEAFHPKELRETVK